MRAARYNIAAMLTRNRRTYDVDAADAAGTGCPAAKLWHQSCARFYVSSTKFCVKSIFFKFGGRLIFFAIMWFIDVSRWLSHLSKWLS
jgi:hypothetical protein